MVDIHGHTGIFTVVCYGYTEGMIIHVIGGGHNGGYDELRNLWVR